MNTLKEQLLRVVRLEEVVERYLPLGQRGSANHTLVGLCPFHTDRHPSLRVRVDKQYYKCFACGEGGDVFRFVQQIEGIGFREALEKMAAWYGLSAGTSTVLSLPVRRKVPHFNPVAVASPAAIAYLLREHGVMLSRLMVYTPSDAALVDTYRAFEVGKAPALLPAAYQSLCQRLTFPIRNEAGELVAFAGRYPGEPKEGVAKYVNSPTTVVYQKERLLYGLYQAREAILQHGFVYITEGYKDVLAMHAAGLPHTVALCGTALTAHHAALLTHYTRRAVVMLDGDAAGAEGSRKAAAHLQAAGIAVSYLTLAPGEDPDSLLHRLGKEAFVSAIRCLTNICRLETYERELLAQQQALYAELALALSPEDRQRMLRELMPLRRRLGQVTKRLGRNVVVKKV